MLSLEVTSLYWLVNRDPHSGLLITRNTRWITGSIWQKCLKWGWILKELFTVVIGKMVGKPLGRGPLIINATTLYSGYLLGISLLKGSNSGFKQLGALYPKGPNHLLVLVRKSAMLASFLSNKNMIRQKSTIKQGSLNYPFSGNQTMQKCMVIFDGLPIFFVHEVWVGNIITPVKFNFYLESWWSIILTNSP